MFSLWRSIDKYDKLAFILGLLVTIKIRVIGVFSASEIILLAMFVFTQTSQYKDNRYVRRLLFYAVLWTIGTVVSNVYNHIEQIDFLKGVFFLVVMVCIIPPIYKIVYEKPERLVLFFLGYGLGSLTSQYTAADEAMAESLSADVYVYYSILAFVYGLGYFLYLRGRKRLSLFLCYAIAVIGLFNMARNPFLTGSISLILVLLIEKNRQDDISDSIAYYQKKIPTLFLFAMLAIIAADTIYEPLAANGTLGTYAQEKYYKQTQNASNALEGGRSETFMGIELIKRNPIWGYGSYAKDSNDAFHYEYAKKKHIDYQWGGEADRLLPGHSHIVGAWMQNGILGGVFWLYVIFMMWKVFKSGCLLCEPRMLCLTLFQSVAFMWNVFFSPFTDRVVTMFFLITLLAIYDHYEQGDYDTNCIEELNI